MITFYTNLVVKRFITINGIQNKGVYIIYVYKFGIFTIYLYLPCKCLLLLYPNILNICMCMFFKYKSNMHSKQTYIM